MLNHGNSDVSLFASCIFGDIILDSAFKIFATGFTIVGVIVSSIEASETPQADFGLFGRQSWKNFGDDLGGIRPSKVGVN